MSLAEDLFGGMRGASMEGGRGDRTEIGLYEVKPKKMFVKVSKDPKKAGAKMFICEYEFAKSSCAKHAPGSSGSWAAKFDQYGYTVADIKKLLFAATGFPQNDPDSHEIVELLAVAICDGPECSAAARLKEKFGIDDAAELVIGKTVVVEVASSKTAGGHEYSKHLWSPVE